MGKIILLVLSLIILFNNNLKEKITFHTTDEISSICPYPNLENVPLAVIAIRMVALKTNQATLSDI